MSQPIVLGIDAGGSRTRLRLVAGREVLAELAGPGANPAALPEAVVERRLAALLARLPARPEVACIGAAGAEVPEARARLESVLRRLLPDARLVVLHDAPLVLAAAGREEGVALIAGTGSVAYARDGRGREARAGGWGWLLGDVGSGAWVTREAARVVMRRADEGEPRGALGKGLLEAAGASDEAELSGHLHRLREPAAGRHWRGSSLPPPAVTPAPTGWSARRRRGWSNWSRRSAAGSRSPARSSSPAAYCSASRCSRPRSPAASARSSGWRIHPSTGRCDSPRPHAGARRELYPGETKRKPSPGPVPAPGARRRPPCQHRRRTSGRRRRATGRRS